MEIIISIAWFAGMGLVFGLLLAIASKIFAVKADERVQAIQACLPGANCGGCGYTGCSAYAEAVVQGEAPIGKCGAGGQEVATAMSEIMGVAPAKMERLRAQVMCSGTSEYAKKKYVYEGASDCVSAIRLGGGDKLCPNGCVGLGTCVEVCKFGAIQVEHGVASVDYRLCVGCGACANACPKHLIRMIPFESKHWVGCMSEETGAQTRANCAVGCIGCKICEKNCPHGAISVVRSLAHIDYDLCQGCDICVQKCPRKIIWSADSQANGGLSIARIREDG